MKFYLKKIYYLFRNFFKINPLIYDFPNEKYAPISDSFFFRNDNIKSAFTLSNISSHTNPNIQIEDNVKIFIYSKDGNLLKSLNIILQPFETKKIYFNDLNFKTNYGLFFVFHNFADKSLLIENNSYVTERGYLAFSDNLKFWQYVHGNHNAAYLSSSNQINSLMTKSFFINEFFPQLTFNDCDNFDIILSNVQNYKVKFVIKSFNENGIKIDQLEFKLNSFSTRKSLFKNSNKKIKYIKIYSKLYFPRPIIFKYFGKYFDVLHG